MRVLYDGCLSAEPRSGIERYFTMLVMNLPDCVQVSCSAPGQGRNGRIGGHVVEAPPFPLFKPRRVAGFLNKMYWTGKGFDVVHWIQYGPSQLARCLCVKGVPFVLTVHDLIHEIHGAPPGLLDRPARQASYDKASAILCVSSNTRDDLLRQYEVDPSKVHVVHHGSSIQSSSPTPKAGHGDGRYFLYVGPRGGYKNFPAIMPGLKAVTGVHPDVKLRIVGNPLGEGEKEMVRDFGLAGAVVEEGRVDDRRLGELYAGAVALLHPSLHEGFGIPLVEAMSCGTVPVATYSSCVPEVLGDAGVHVRPDEVQEGFHAAMLNLLDDPGFRKSKVAGCLERAKRFNWKETANRTFEVYSSVTSPM